MTHTNKFIYSIPDEKYYLKYYPYDDNSLFFLLYGYQDGLLVFAMYTRFNTNDKWFKSEGYDICIEEEIKYLKNNTFPSNTDIQISYDSYIKPIY